MRIGFTASLVGDRCGARVGGEREREEVVGTIFGPTNLKKTTGFLAFNINIATAGTVFCSIHQLPYTLKK